MTVAYWILYWLVREALSLWLNISVKGLENVPRKGALIIVANHVSAFDPPTVGAIMPRSVHFMAKAELFEYPILPRLLKYAQAYPVHRGHPDRRAIRRSLDILAHEGAILLFPEGHRSATGELQQARAGAIYLAQKSGCRLLPVGIMGPYGFRRRVTFNIGPAFSIPSGMDKATAQVLVMDRIRQQLQGLDRRQKL